MKTMNTFLNRFHAAEKGQAMAEFCVVAPLLIILWWSIWYLSDMYTIKNKTLVAARYGSWLLSRYDNLPGHEITPDDVRGLIASRFFDGSMEGLTIKDTYEETGSDVIQGISDDSDSGPYNAEIIDSMENQLALPGKPSTYSLQVTHAFPNVFGAVDLRDLQQGPFMIQSRHFVDGNSWDGGRVELHDLFELVEGLIKDVIVSFEPVLEDYQEGVADCKENG